jgi:hypothetical protein
MKGISQELNEIIKQEVLSHQVNERKDAIKEERRIIARHKIEDILAAKQLEASLELHC